MNLDGINVEEEIVDTASSEFGKELSDESVSQISNKVRMILEMTPEGKISDIIKKQIELLLENEKFKLGYYKALSLYKKISGKDDVDFYSFNPNNPGKLIKYIRPKIEDGNYLKYFPFLINRFKQLIELFGEPIKKGTIAYKESGKTGIIKRLTKDGGVILEGEKGTFYPHSFCTKEEYNLLLGN